jgi:hypothetical protein
MWPTGRSVGLFAGLAISTETIANFLTDTGK